MRVTLLGTGAPLSPDRAMTGMVVTAPGCAPLMIDTCGGFELARRLAASAIPIGDVRNVVLTHRHMDHIGGMPALLLARQPLDIFASPDTHAGVAALMQAAFPEWHWHDEVASHEVAAGETRDIGGFTVGFFACDHRVPTLAVRVTAGGRTFAFSADSRPTADLVACARDADVFLCDAICAEADGEAAVERANWTMHPTAREAAEMATQAGARRLVCTHIGRFGSPDRIAQEAARHFSGAASVAADGQVIDV